MTTRPLSVYAFLVLAVLADGRAAGGPQTREQGERQRKLVSELKAVLAAGAANADKVSAFARAYKAEPDPDVRRVVLDMLPDRPDVALEGFLSEVLTGDKDAGIRSLAAKALGTRGSDRCLPTLVKAAGTDQVTDCQMGCLGSRGTARRQATFAIAELASRHPRLAGEAAAGLRGLTPPADPHDNESLADARDQALYQITRDEKLLAPFLERFRSQDANVREGGVGAFRFLKLKVAPPEVMAALGDTDAGVRSCAAMVLGEIADPKTVPALMAVAGDSKQNINVRCNAVGSLGQMKAAAATGLMRTLLADEKKTVQVSAAIALYRLTGEKVKQFPPGYNAD